MPPPSATAVVDAGIELFARLLPLQDLSSMLTVVKQIVESVTSPKLEKSSGRRAAVNINATIAILLFLRHASTHHSRQVREAFADGQIVSLLSSFLQVDRLDSV
jgi:hypothetical protein